MKFAQASFAILAIVFLSMGQTALADQSYPMIDVKVDRAKVMRVSRAASMVIIGNPAIADATIKDSQTLIITGKQYGTTNLIVLDAEGEPIADEILSVSSAMDSNVVVYKGTDRYTLHCSPNCEPVYRVGDQKDKLAELNTSIQSRGQLSEGGETGPSLE
ncbi:pilus assembly protein N-terminal domain-containing protein [uncultured Cohaesibacter sp.]|uniref:pilus assembly protein N-terminal domain-containing protein n=1 Tax=uncultured Cohaesibacter sp. TaxID=1002546 RepID=UPI002AABFFCE|nr:pilus assembly protein N-terminal domain-containing protein [uncultured Cohaesibacter sp.]